jgi:hypothetical protein
MPPRAGSRHSQCIAYRDEEGRTLLTEREPYRFHDHGDTRVHTAAQGDTLFSLAGRYFEPLPRACGFWWVIADFNDVVDATLELEIGRRIFIPSVRTLTEVILARPPAGGAA